MWLELKEHGFRHTVRGWGCLGSDALETKALNIRAGVSKMSTYRLHCNSSWGFIFKDPFR